jgi:hypothetical protein
MGGTKCLRLGTCELKDMGGVLQNDSSISVKHFAPIRSKRARGVKSRDFHFRKKIWLTRYLIMGQEARKI